MRNIAVNDFNTSYTLQKILHTVQTKYDQSQENETHPNNISEGSNSKNLSMAPFGMRPEKMHIYPNPQFDLINIEWQASKSEDTNISLISLTGQQISMNNIDAQKGRNKATLDISTIKSGVYLVVQESESNRMVERWIKN